MKIISGLTEGQVLQRLGKKGATIRIVGTCADEGIVHASIGKRNRLLKNWNSKVVGKSRLNRFDIQLSDIPVGGPYRLKLRCGSKNVSVDHFYVGDVWVLAGQSNMEGVGDMTGAATPHPLIHVLTLRREWRLAKDPLHIRAESPDSCHSVSQCSMREGEKLRQSAKKGVGPGIFFAREMFKRSDVPQGLIVAAHGGTSMEQWNPMLKGRKGDSLYGSMLLSVKATGQPIRGILWYQGENDALSLECDLYTDRMKKLIAAARRDLRQPELPWLIVQLARIFGCYDPKAVESWNSIQEQQRLLPTKIENIETIPTIDLELDDMVHIGAKGCSRLGIRMAQAADRLVYRNAREKRPPQLKSIIIKSFSADGAIVEVTYDQVVGGLKSSGAPNGFSLINSENGKLPFIYKTTLHGNIVRLYLIKTCTSKADMVEMQLSYGFGLSPYCNITDTRDYSLPVFGPRPFFPPKGYLPYVKEWKVTGIIASAAPFEGMACPDMEAHQYLVRNYGLTGLIDNHFDWRGKSGRVYFECDMTLDEEMKLNFLLGYDCPFRLWLDGKPFFSDLKGTHPCVADQSSKMVAVSRGIHKITVALDISSGDAWGFYLRFCRADITPSQIRTKKYVRPVYSVSTS